MGHSFLIAAFCATWVIQLGYVAWMLLKWQGQRSKLDSRP
jgi:nucleoside recognition membrane protein YjiH